MKDICLKIFSYELQKHNNVLLYEWVIAQAKKMNLPGASVFRGIAGYGRHHLIHEEHFFELASDVPVEIIFILSELQADEFIAELKNQNLDLVYIKIPTL